MKSVAVSYTVEEILLAVNLDNIKNAGELFSSTLKNLLSVLRADGKMASNSHLGIHSRAIRFNVE